MSELLDRYNRRKYQRFGVDKPTNYAITRVNPEKEGQGIVKDISSNGVGLDICDALVRKAYLLVEISTGDPKTSITIGGKIIWFKNYGDFSSCGIKLEWVSNEDAYTGYIKRLEAASGIC